MSFDSTADQKSSPLTYGTKRVRFVYEHMDLSIRIIKGLSTNNFTKSVDKKYNLDRRVVLNISVYLKANDTNEFGFSTEENVDSIRYTYMVFFKITKIQELKSEVSNIIFNVTMKYLSHTISISMFVSNFMDEIMREFSPFFVSHTICPSTQSQLWTHTR